MFSQSFLVVFVSFLTERVSRLVVYASVWHCVIQFVCLWRVRVCLLLSLHNCMSQVSVWSAFTNLCTCIHVLYVTNMSSLFSRTCARAALPEELNLAARRVSVAVPGGRASNVPQLARLGASFMAQRGSTFWPLCLSQGILKNKSRQSCRWPLPSSPIHLKLSRVSPTFWC